MNKILSESINSDFICLILQCDKVIDKCYMCVTSKVRYMIYSIDTKMIGENKDNNMTITFVGSGIDEMVLMQVLLLIKDLLSTYIDILLVE